MTRDEFDVTAESTEQALARFEAECGWSDVGRFAEAFAPARSMPADPGAHGAG